MEIMGCLRLGKDVVTVSTDVVNYYYYYNLYLNREGH